MYRVAAGTWETVYSIVLGPKFVIWNVWVAFKLLVSFRERPEVETDVFAKTAQ